MIMTAADIQVSIYCACMLFIEATLTRKTALRNTEQLRNTETL